MLSQIKQLTEKSGLDALYPDQGPLSRDKYWRYVKALTAGKEHIERAILGGNRVGKTYGIGGYETALHATGLYPTWWEGHVIAKQALLWAAGTKAVKVRDVNQDKLIGKLIKRRGFTQAKGGLIPSNRIVRLTRRSGVSDAIDQVVIKHSRGWENTITFKSYEEGRTSFEGEACDFIWLDEEPPKDVYDECKMRIITTGGRMLSTFTPLQGMSETVLAMLKDSGLI